LTLSGDLAGQARVCLAGFCASSGTAGQTTAGYEISPGL